MLASVLAWAYSEGIGSPWSDTLFSGFRASGGVRFISRINLPAFLSALMRISVTHARAYRNEMESSGELSNLDSSIGADGKERTRGLIREQLKETPEQSDRQIAKALGVHQTTVGTQRKELEEEGQVSKSDTSTGADGKEYPRTTKPKTVYQPPASEPEQVTEPEFAKTCTNQESIKWHNFDIGSGHKKTPPGRTVAGQLGDAVCYD